MWKVAFRVCGHIPGIFKIGPSRFDLNWEVINLEKLSNRDVANHQGNWVWPNNMQIIKNKNWGLPGCPGVKTPCFHCRGTESISGQRTKIPHVTWPRQTNKNKHKQIKTKQTWKFQRSHDHLRLAWSASLLIHWVCYPVDNYVVTIYSVIFDTRSEDLKKSAMMWPSYLWALKYVLTFIKTSCWKVVWYKTGQR